jgi:hypothetical protein
MKKFSIKVSLFLLLIVVTCIIIEIMIRLIPNEYRYKSEYLAKNSGNIEVLFVGASDAHAGFNPEYMNSQGFNAANPAQSLDYSFEIMKKYKNSWPNLKYVVLAVSYPSLFYKMEASLESWRIKNYTIYYSLNSSKQLKYHAEITNGRLFDHFLRLSKYYIKNIDEIHCNDLGWYISSTSPPLDSLYVLGKRAVRRHTIPKEQQRISEMKSALDSIIDFTVKNNSRIILCTPPVYKSYSENVNNFQMDSTFNTIIRTANTNSNCTYINLFDDPRFKDEDFLDGDHLNGIGARKLTLLIDSIIKSQSGIKPVIAILK